MDLRGFLRRTAMQRPAVLTVALPGATQLRLAVEAEVRGREWPTASAPAAADLLVVCGAPEPEDREWLDCIKRSMPEPAVRIMVEETGHVAHALDRARRELTGRAATPREHEADRQWDPTAGGSGAHAHGDDHDHRAHHGSSPSQAPDDHGRRHQSADQGHDGHATHLGQEGHERHDPDDHDGHMDHMDQEGHAGHMDHMGHDMHAMGEVAGLAMAERGDDRDELRLDQLHVPIGPGLPDWPTGLILRLTLQGDVVQGVEVDHLPAPPGHRMPFWDEPWLRAAQGEEVSSGSAARQRCAAHLDSVGRLLAVVGWHDVAARCRRLRDEVLSGASRLGISRELGGVLRGVERSRVLRWSIAGLGELPSSRAGESGVTGPALAANGDSYDRLRMWVDEIERALEVLDDERPLTPGELTGPRGRLDGEQPPSRALLDILPELLTGAEFACARIIVASLDPDIDELALTPVSGAAHA
ncbi:hypothetical protein Stsp02_20240 [Streptomyces sp. NBRC 14336]|uniref:Uncharacterized protein n=1 Tax=Streptomyces thermocarboxydovorans TaxID=59298 RepID=A0ABN1HFD3_9ACTN|nr:hypothetical protein [Streptomyces sp. NBRC 14336]GLW46362.1 hypothetical protein Stsp02_20240 [Streptomyces sp. NBRC 14336]